MRAEPRDRATSAEGIDELLQRYCDAAVAAGHTEAYTPDEYHETDPDVDRAWELVEKLRTEVGLRIRALEAAAAPAAPPRRAARAAPTPEPRADADLDAIEGPRTYEASFLFNDVGGPRLMTAEEWLKEEANVWAAMQQDDDPADEPNRGGTMLAIAREIETIRRERSQWAASHTALATELRALRAERDRLTADAPSAAPGADVEPMQPVVMVDGVARFRQNAIVRTLLDTGKLTLNDLARMEFSREDREQFAQLIGYSVGGYSELSYVSDASYARAQALADAARAGTAAGEATRDA